MTRADKSISRRQALKLAGTAGATSLLAGCGLGGDNGDGNGDLGERVPTMTATYFTGHAGTPFHERALPVVIDHWRQLGVDAEPKPTEVGEAVMEPWNDERVSPIHIWNHSPTLFRLDPETMLRRFKIDFAGPGGDPNTPNYASCEASVAIDRVQNATTEEEKEAATYDALEQISEDLAVLPMMPAIIQGAYNNSRVELSAGAAGMSNSNVEMYNTITASHNDTIVGNCSDFVVERLNMLNIGDGRANSVWTGVIHSPLFYYDEEFNFIHVLAEDYEVANEGKQLTVDILPDATFHNGDDLTAEEVQWTFETLRDNADAWPYPEAHDGEIEVLGDKQVRFTFPESQLSALTKLLARWGIMHPDTWDPELLDDPSGFDPAVEDFVGSGPYRVVEFQSGSLMSLEPFEDHAVYSPGNPLFLQAYENTSTAVEAFNGGELDLLCDLGGGDMDRVRSNAPEDTTTLEEVPTFVPDPLYPQLQYPPTQFREFRLAIGNVMDLNEVNDIARFGASEPDPYATIFMEAHPFRAPDDRMTRYTDDVSGNVDTARSILEEEGWGWDNNDRLHYPQDADLTPRWPQGEGPNPDDFACLDSDGNYVNPE